MSARILPMIVALTLLTAAVSSAFTLTVRLDGSGDFTSIQPALTSAAAGDTVRVGNGTFTGPENRDLTFGGKDLVVLSESDDPDSCVIDCAAGPGDEHRGFLFDGDETGAAVLRGIQIRGGWVSGSGGGILCTSADLDSVPAPRIENCVLTENTAGSGGGIAVVGFSVPYMSDCVVTANTGGGGFWTGVDSYSAAGASLVENSDFSGNTGPGLRVSGDGFYPWGENLRYRDCNSSDNTGTGLDVGNLSGVVEAEACTLNANGGWGVTFPNQAVPNGPATRALPSGWPTLTDCLVTDNTSGGIFGDSDVETYLRCTVSGNHGPGIYDATGQATEIIDCFVEDNDGFGIFVTGYETALHGNTVRGNGDFGVWVDWNDGAIDIHDNVITGNGDFGLKFYAADPASDVLLENNILSGNTGHGLVIDGAAFSMPFELVGNTIAGNLLNGVECLTTVDVHVTRTIIAFNGQEALGGGCATSAVLACADLYGNQLGDYIGDLSLQLGVDGNISEDPVFCDPDAGVYTIHALSPCLDGNHPDEFACGTIGAEGMGCPPPHAGPSWNVSVAGDDFFGNGSSTYPFATIQQALDFAAQGDTIFVGPGTYSGDGNRDLDFDGKDLTLQSESGDPANCIIDCGGSDGDEHRGFLFSGLETSAASISGFTVRGGWVSGDGGGILLQWSGVDSLPAPRIEHCVFEANTAGRGAGMSVVGPASPRVTDCAFTDNVGHGVAISGDDLGAGLVLGTSLVAGNSLAGLSVDVALPSRWLDLSELTVADNGGHGIECLQPICLDLATSIVAFNGQRALSGHDPTTTLACVDFHDNLGGDFVDDLAAWDGQQGNFSANPWFQNRSVGDYALLDISPCVSGQHPDGDACGTIGALAVGGLAAAVITQVDDVANDQGRQVRLNWDASGFDHAGSELPITGYGIYRQQDDAPPPVSGLHRDLGLPLPGWDFLVTVPARGDSAYQFVAPTLCDSTEAGICWSTFIVSAMTDDPYTYFDSDEASGYSVDDIVPPAPELFTVEYRPDTHLSWQAAVAPDLAWYNVYRGDTAEFVPGESNLVAQVTGTEWDDIDAGWDFYYRVSSVDDATNESEPVEPDHQVAVHADIPSVTALVGNAPNPFNPATTISFNLAGDEAVSLHVYDLSGRMVRTLVSGDVMAQGRHDVVWRGRDDRGRQVASGMYLYRMQAGGVVETRRMALIK